jgi:hypothetical protein
VAEPIPEALGKEAALFGSKLDPRGILEPTLLTDVWDACVRQADPANHNPPAASSAAIARNRYFLFIFSVLVLSLRQCAWISGGWLSIWNEGGEFWCEAPPRRNEPVPSRVD